jgi:hypothetical protein
VRSRLGRYRQTNKACKEAVELAWKIESVRHFAVFPGQDFGFEALASTDPTVEALGTKYADFDLDHVEPAAVLGGIVELWLFQQAACFASWKGLVERTG